MKLFYVIKCIETCLFFKTALSASLFNLDFLPTVKGAPRSPDGRAGRSQTDSGPGAPVAASKENLPVLNTRIICPGSTDSETWCIFKCFCENV